MKNILLAVLLLTGLAAVAAIAPTVTNAHRNESSPKGYIFAWRLVSADGTGTEVGTEVQVPTLKEKSVQMTGTYGTAVVVLQGSNDCSNFYSLKVAPSGLTSGDVSSTTAGLYKVLEHTKCIRARATSVQSSTDVTVSVLATE